MYNILTTGFSFILSVFYGKIDVIGLENIPKKGPVVFCGTHGNGLIGMHLLELAQIKLTILQILF